MLGKITWFIAKLSIYVNVLTRKEKVVLLLQCKKKNANVHFLRMNRILCNMLCVK